VRSDDTRALTAHDDTTIPLEQLLNLRSTAEDDAQKCAVLGVPHPPELSDSYSLELICHMGQNTPGPKYSEFNYWVLTVIGSEMQMF
jgi:hypothetical protein